MVRPPPPPPPPPPPTRRLPRMIDSLPFSQHSKWRMLRFQFSSRCGLLTNYSIPIAISISHWKDSGWKVVYVGSTPISICDCDGKVRAIALRLRLRLHGNATASLKSAYVYYVYDHQRHLLTTTSLQIGIVPQLLCYSVYSKGAVLHFLCCMRVIRSSHNATF